MTLRRVADEVGSGTRTGDAVITAVGATAPPVVLTALPAADALAAVWPEVSNRLTRLLASRGAAPDVVDDIVQEVAARVLARGIAFDGAMDLMRWAVPVALNLLVDHARATKRVAVGEDVDSTVPDIADVVIDRDRLGRVLGAVARLSAGDRAALVATAAPAADRRESVRLAVRRHRARRRLLAMVDGAAGLAAWVGLRVWLRLGVRLRRSRTAALTASMAFALPVALFVHLPGYAPAPPDRGTHAHVPAAPPRVLRLDAATASRALRTAPASARTRPVPSRHATPRRTVPPRRLAGAGPHQANVALDERPAATGDGLVCLRRTGVLDDVCLLPGN